MRLQEASLVPTRAPDARRVLTRRKS